MNTTDTQLLTGQEFTARSRKPERPYCWQCKRALKAIIEHPDVTNRVNALLVYFAMTWIASDLESETFQIAKGLVAHKTGLGKRTVAEALYDLERAGVIVIHRKKQEGKKAYDVNVYTLCSFGTTGKANSAQGGDASDAQSSCKRSAHHLHGNRNKARRALFEGKNIEAPQSLPAALPDGSAGASGAQERKSSIGGYW